MTRIRLILLGLGLAFLGYLVTQVGPETLLASFQTLSWRLLLIVWFPFALITVLDTLGWRYAFGRNPASFSTLVAVRLAGEAFNVTTPTASMGGEPVKAYLLRPQVPLGEALASVIVAKTTIALAQGLFLVVGITLALITLPPAAPLLNAMTWLAAAEAVALGGFVLAQQKGLFEGGLRFVRGLGLSWVNHGEEGVRRLDLALSAFYREHPGRLTLSLLFHFGGWVVGSLEVYLILHFIGVFIPLTTVLVIEAFVAAIKSAAFLIPAGVGAQEGGNMAIFAALGLGAGVGLTVTLVRRVRELTWVAAGLVALSVFRATPAGPELT
ncbi:MAG: flippase-like domain-containing protein [Candidatus Rokubacteria bacterium]|nr:flippase-like domain-containing protein [Candidatus Rokubacteria bacterium]